MIACLMFTILATSCVSSFDSVARGMGTTVAICGDLGAQQVSWKWQQK
tara:strand:- start:401 stop:544 length:144 start_codon:yes stop_codon:yes gene_type:complete